MRALQYVMRLMGAAVLLVGTVSGQEIRDPRDREPGGRGTGNLNLVQNAALQKELQLTVDQLEKIRQIPQIIKTKLKDQFAEMEKLEGPARREKSRELRKVFAEEFPRQLALVLTPAQEKRVKQIFLQQGGVQAFLQAEVDMELHLTAAQKERLQEIVRQTNKEALEIYRTLPDDAEAGVKVAAVERANMARAVAVLTERQRQKWNDLLGPPFETAYHPARVGSRPFPDKRPAHIAEPISGTDLSWIDKRVADWEATADERRMDRIGFAAGILAAERLAKEYGRPVFLFNYSGRIDTGRC
jgi:hypothetical protein